MDPEPSSPPPSSTEPPSTAAESQPPPSSPPPPPSAPSIPDNPPPPPSVPTSSTSETPSTPPQPQPPQSQPQPQPPQSQPQPQPQLQQRPPLPRPHRPPSPYSHFMQSMPSAAPAPSSAPSSLASPSPSLSAAAGPRGSMAIGVPAAHQHPRAAPTLSSYGPMPPFSQPFGSFPRPEQSAASSAQVGTPIPGSRSIGMFGSLSAGPHMRPSGFPGQLQHGPSQPLMRSSSPSSNQSAQKFQGHGLSRNPSIASPSPASTVPQNQPQQMISAQGKQIQAASLPSSSLRPQMKPHSLQQRPHQLQPHQQQQQQQHQHQQQQQQQQQKHQQQQLQQQLFQQPQQHASLSHQAQEHHSQQYVPLRNQQSISQQQQAARVHGSAQKSNLPASVQPGASQSGVGNAANIADAAESGNQILSKRSIRELVAQIDPSEKLDPEVEDTLVEIADDFIGSITTFACSLAKHRSSKTLEAKDILLHVERNWNMTLPGFSGDEIKYYKKQATNDIHKERISAIRKSMVGNNDSGNVKNPLTAQAALGAKAHATKVPATTNQAERGS